MTGHAIDHVTGSGSRVLVTIDEVVVSGLSPADARRAVLALDTRLASLLADPGGRLPARDASIGVLRPRPASSGSGATLGITAAEAIHAAVRGGGR